MANGEKPPPDFAMLRAAELLAQMHRAQRRKKPEIETFDAPAVLKSSRFSFEVNVTQRPQVERELGVAFAYPARGWHTYATRENGTRCFLSAFYKQTTLIAVELYIPEAKHAPSLLPVDFGGFELQPRGVRIGMDASHIFEARFPGGAAYVKAHGASVDRIALYSAGAPQA
jgi:hypothetical protein